MIISLVLWASLDLGDGSDASESVPLGFGRDHASAVKALESSVAQALAIFLASSSTTTVIHTASALSIAKSFDICGTANMSGIVDITNLAVDDNLAGVVTSVPG